MKIKDLHYNKETGELRTVGKAKFFGGGFFPPNTKPEIILTRKEAVEKGMNPDLKNGKGYFARSSDNIRIPITIK